MTMKQRLKIIGAVSYTHADPSRKILKHFSGQNSTNLSHNSGFGRFHIRVAHGAMQIFGE